jgi:hypothetical protein
LKVRSREFWRPAIFALAECPARQRGNPFIPPALAGAFSASSPCAATPTGVADAGTAPYSLPEPAGFTFRKNDRNGQVAVDRFTHSIERGLPIRLKEPDCRPEVVWRVAHPSTLSLARTHGQRLWSKTKICGIVENFDGPGRILPVAAPNHREAYRALGGWVETSLKWRSIFCRVSSVTRGRRQCKFVVGWMQSFVVALWAKCIARS